MKTLVCVLIIGLTLCAPLFPTRAQNSKVAAGITAKEKVSLLNDAAKKDDRSVSSTSAADPKASAKTASERIAENSFLPALTSLYWIGVGDVLDIRLLNGAERRESTLYTVMAGGLLEYPLAGEPLVVAGMTTDEVGVRLAELLKRRAVTERPQVLVSVREYVSHTVLVSGLANSPGAKVLRREAMPLYVIIAEAQPRPDAGRATVIARATGEGTIVDLNDAASMNMLVHPGDVINLTGRPKEFFFIGGQVNSPGQKDFHAGLTLTQAVLAAGGMTPGAGGKIKVSRQGADGLLSLTEYKLKDIQSGKTPDPPLQSGDRIEVGRGRW
ncbi:MAG TPA: polysaccharide biosynthesis/export family protein [Pyrinomonadaceae bacterium]|jgi:protein involved in polysaccharide export with SLBB domain|nr:polysaccharide biosynthesis/export family protein [Pyrinomonadaceae bacterium]